MDGVRAHPAENVQIRAADTGDAPQIAACLEAAFAPYRELYTPAAYADTVPGSDGILHRIAAMHVLVAVAGDQVAGTIAGALSQRGEGHLRGMAVLPEWQGSGIASQLLVAIEDYLQGQGCCRVTLDTTLPLQHAIRFYQRHGYRPSGVRGNFFGMPIYEYAKDW
jgi:GNAT superfamily N-acetyltransferase